MTNNDETRCEKQRYFPNMRDISFFTWPLSRATSGFTPTPGGYHKHYLYVVSLAMVAAYALRNREG